MVAKAAGLCHWSVLGERFVGPAVNQAGSPDMDDVSPRRADR